MFKYVVLEKETNEPDISKGERYNASPIGKKPEYWISCPFKKKPYGVVTLWRGWLDGVRVTRLGWSKCNEKDEFDLGEGIRVAKAREMNPREVLTGWNEDTATWEDDIPHDIAKVIKKMAAEELGYRT